MERDTYKQGRYAAARSAKSGRGQEHKAKHSPLTVRSPALQSAERQQRKPPAPVKKSFWQELVAGPTEPKKRQERNKKVSYAVEGKVAPQIPVRRKLPPLKRGAEAAPAREPVSRGGGARSWRKNGPSFAENIAERLQVERQRGRQRVQEPNFEPVQVMSKEEQQKLRELEMSLSRTPGKVDSVLLVVVLGLVCIGLIMVYSASSFISTHDYNDPSAYFQRQAISGFFGVIAMLVTARIDYRYWRRFSLIALAVALPLLVLVLFFGTNAYGASRWFRIGNSFSFQPSELTKLALALYIADWLARKGNQVSSFLYGLTPFVILVGLILGLVLLENDMGTAIVIAGLATVMFFTAGANIIQFLLAMVGGILIFMTQAFKGYRLYRLLGFLNPFQNVTSINLQLYQSLLALGSGGFLGLGLGESRQKTGYLPFPHIDSIFAIVGEELGFVGAALIIILFLCLAFRGFRLARRTQDMYGALLATGITTWLILQAAVNIGATSAFIPYTGVPLPFISFGGTSLVISLAAVGILLNISRYIRQPEDPALSRQTITRTFKRKV
ncbi:putative lipid II flippase FtsW [Ktedonobacter racemifer]|uniref:Probable peptidoglycan glycosyltransferase FtsW n=1 Tax=Ktedonobacter racemifer DSM 44963 TaxID=485913 RepID=D6TNI6_KTERA|nr:putative lipid II flippase FtsW [Ktedonobacter racemifer]EFH87317.1 cell division protein FtsW [Ktedonobacter racemifer DSM 44963]